MSLPVRQDEANARDENHNDVRFTLIGTFARRMRQGFASDAPQLHSLWLRECV
jgi:hypothetical protein